MSRLDGLFVSRKIAPRTLVSTSLPESGLELPPQVDIRAAFDYSPSFNLQSTSPTTKPTTAMIKTEVAKQTSGMNADRLGMPGWQTLARTVRGLDEEKVRSTKDDIDTLLVFAGLFSAVLSALLVQSYLGLQPDSATQTVTLLQQMTSQNYTVNSGHVNVTSLSPASSPFAAPAWALRVNGLWFASLILSLAASSLGMLVKSWLREYLAGDWTSPQMQLRARQYRHPALADWKVFEIAAALPLLIQLSLGLFFVGLCIFTKSVDERMFWTSVPLVGAWALFFLVTTFAPLLSPRCPYKIFFIRRLLALTRNVTLSAIAFAFARLPPVLPLHNHISAKWLAKLERDPASRSASGGEKEEEDTVFSARNDKSILMQIDETMMDDGELGAICEAYRSSRPNPEEVITFILELIHRRLGLCGEEMPTSPLSSVLDLTRLSLAAYQALMKTVSSVIQYNNTVFLRNGSPTWLGDAVILLLSSSPYSLPHEAHNSLIEVLSDMGQHSLGCKAVGKLIGLSKNKQRPFVPLARQLASLCHSGNQIMIASPLHIYNKVLGAHVETGMNLLETLWSHPALLEDAAVRPILDDIWEFIHRMLLVQRSRMPYRKGMMYCLIFLYQFAPQLGKEEPALELLTEYWSSRAQIFRLLMLGTAISPLARLPDSIVYAALEKASLHGEPEYRPMVISATVTLMNDNNNDKLGATFEPLDIVRFCHLFVRLYVAFVRHAPGRGGSPQGAGMGSIGDCSPATQAAYVALWGKLGTAVKKYWDSKGWARTQDRTLNYWRVTTQTFTTADEILKEDRAMAAQCLRLIAELDTREARRGTALPTAIPPASLFPETLVSALKKFTEREDVSSSAPSRLQPQAGSSST